MAEMICRISVSHPGQIVMINVNHFPVAGYKHELDWPEWRVKQISIGAG
jgi:hypothetical protein